MVDVVGVGFVIPFFAGVIGAPSYLLLGLPAMYLTTRRWGARVRVFTLAGMAASLLSPLLVVAQLLMDGRTIDPQMRWLLFFGLLPMGLIFSALWCGFAGLLYRWIDRRFPQ
ncbi:hypothetical protein [Oceaniglobus indicus]|uniref:hypothetical protein n=1 Tax=Oceaniglobus indicus TaxID=2047749 RepID=UPI00130444D7|nr:hypothetical protein [Oceaniglobus indicus]